MFFSHKKPVLTQLQRILLILTLSFLLCSPVLFASSTFSGFENSILPKIDDVVLLGLPNSTEVIDGIANDVNMYYEYDDVDINVLLLLRAQEEGLDLDGIILMPPLDNTGSQIAEQLQEENMRYRERVLAGEEPVARTILIPVNLYNIRHWVGLVIKLDTQNRVLQIQYIDPLGNSTFEESIPEKIREALRTLYGEVHIDNVLLLRQTDGAACGVLTVENLVRAAQGHIDTEVAHENLTRQIRNHHIDLLDRYRPDLRTNNVFALSMAGQLRDLCFITDGERISTRLDKLLALDGFKPCFLGAHYIQHNSLPTKYLLIGVEGPSLSGKSYLTNSLTSKLKYYGYDTYIVEEYVNFANGHANFPPMLSKSLSDSSKCANFFIQLEQKRVDYLRNLLKTVNKEKISIIFVDRLIFSILYYRKLVNDIPSINIITEPIIRGQYIHPDFTLLLQPPKDRTEVIRRRKTRTEFPGSELIFGPLGSNNYVDYFKDINILRINIIILQ